MTTGYSLIFSKIFANILFRSSSRPSVGIAADDARIIIPYFRLVFKQICRENFFLFPLPPTDVGFFPRRTSGIRKKRSEFTRPVFYRESADKDRILYRPRPSSYKSSDVSQRYPKRRLRYFLPTKSKRRHYPTEIIL